MQMQKPVMTPAPGERLLRFIGDQVSFALRDAHGSPFPAGWQGRLRTNLGRADILRREIIHAHTRKLRLTDASWRDIAMDACPDGWRLTLSLTQVGFFQAKTYAIDPKGWQHWPEGADVGLSVHPDNARTANTIYCAFARMFGETKTEGGSQDSGRDAKIATLDKLGYTVIPPSGKLRDLIRELPHIVGALGCRIIHLLPVNPAPTTYARFGRFGSPYACQDFLAIDPALIEFDKRTTGIDQFRELTYAVHSLGARVFLDVVINHTGWGSALQENHPEWFVRAPDGAFVSPGAWGVTWEDLVELHHRNPDLWEYLAEVFLEWCRRGVDGFRCDAGYKIPVHAWRYITARVLQEFPETIFLLEGLGGSWETTEELLTRGGMQWAYSELFQNYSARQISDYLDYSLRQSERVGVYVHYSETHDNDRLAAKGRAWSLLRNQLCALTSVNGAFGFTSGVEWLAAEKLQVHQSRGLAWENSDNIVAEISRLNQLLSGHPCFFEGARVARLSAGDSPVYALKRVSEEGKDQVLVLANTDLAGGHELVLDEFIFRECGSPSLNLLGPEAAEIRRIEPDRIGIRLGPAQCFCLASSRTPLGLSGDHYRQLRALAAWASTTINRRFRAQDISPYDWRWLADLVLAGEKDFLAAVEHLDAELVRCDLVEAVEKAMRDSRYPRVVTWKLASRARITPVPCNHWLLIEDSTPFRAVLKLADGSTPQHLRSVQVHRKHIACFPPGQTAGEAELELERYAEQDRSVQAGLRFITLPPVAPKRFEVQPAAGSTVALLTNGRGGMARLQVDFGTVQSKYDCLLAANLNPRVPVDRHVFVKRARLWLVADGFITPLDQRNLIDFIPGPPARWRFVASAGDQRAVEVLLTADMLPDGNTTVLRFERPDGPLPFGRELPEECRVALTLRVDIEDRNFHSETHRNGGADHHFNSHTHLLAGAVGFEFAPAADRKLRVVSDDGSYHPQPEWCEHVPHPVEATRGQVSEGAAFSPGWFDLPLPKGKVITLAASADAEAASAESLSRLEAARLEISNRAAALSGLAETDRFGGRLAQAIQAYVVRRDEGKTVIAGYPWFLDWGRDSLICARGLVAAGLVDDVQRLLMTFARFAENGTLPNSIHGEDASNRDTSDAPLWFGVVCEELAAVTGPALFDLNVDSDGRTIGRTLLEIAAGYRDGTPNGIRMDRQSGLIWSPGHFTWMDTNHPAATPREGYPVEIQVLWIRLLRLLERLDIRGSGSAWGQAAARSEESFDKLYWREERGYLADLLIAPQGQPAAEAMVDTALRSNFLFAISFGLVRGERARRALEAALEYLVVPGALRSLAPLPVSPPLAIRAADGRLLNNPAEPYRGRYEGDEDTSRKLAYHNGTAWTWTFPVFCEALAKAWDFDAAAIEAARTYLGSMDRLLSEGCLGHLPEIVDGDAPHAQRGCDAQAWSATEALRVWKLLS